MNNYAFGIAPTKQHADEPHLLKDGDQSIVNYVAIRPRSKSGRSVQGLTIVHYFSIALGSILLYLSASLS
jgi:hypothetical protein